MTDEELLRMYRNYKNKRIIIITILIFFIALSSLIVYKFPKMNNNGDSKESEVKETIDSTDTLAPILELTNDYIEIFVGDEIDYLSYVSKAEDDVEGDIKTNVEYNEIDTSIIGEQKIIYHVSDSSKNETIKELVVNIRQKEDISDNNTSNNKGDNKETSVSSENKNESQKGSSNTNKSESSNKNEKIVKYFMFSDGYTMLNVTEACTSELKKYNRAGICVPIQDEEGIYLGMKLEIN